MKHEGCSYTQLNGQYKQQENSSQSRGKFPQSAGDIQQRGRMRCMTPKDQAQIAERLATINQELSWNGVQFKVTKSGLYTIIDKIQGDC